MPSFRDILTAGDADLVKIFYKVKAGHENNFIQQINQTATRLDLNHTQLVCALGFNTSIRDLTDILSVIGFSSYRLLCFRRDELFANDVYRHLDIDNVLDIYATDLADAEILAALRELLLPRLAKIESTFEEGCHAATMISYKMEVHSLYTGGIATAAFATHRVEAPIGDLRTMIEEVQMIVENGVLPPSNLFFSDDLLPAEKRYLIESGHIDQAMIANRLGNREISEDERQLLEDFVG